MKTKLNFSKREFRIISITIVCCLLAGWLFFHGREKETAATGTLVEKTQEKKEVWTCSMHPQIRLDHPGKCPICGMELIPVSDVAAATDSVSPGEILMSADAMKIADIQTMTVKKGRPGKDIYLLGRVKPDERNISALTARFGGRIEKLFVNFTGQQVNKGDKLAVIYSPALVTAQKELLEAAVYRQTNPDLYAAARNKLKLWDLSDGQIDDIMKKGETRSNFDVQSPITGTVTQRNIAPGDYVKEGSPLFEVVDLSKVWVMFDAYESDLPWIRQGDKVTFTAGSLPGENLHGKVGFIDPTIDPVTRTARVRVEVNNEDGLLKPEMFVNGVITSAVAGKSDDLIIPRTAVLWTGKRSVVYVRDPEKQEPVFEYREIILGPSAGDFYVVEQGLREGEEIAVNGVFRIDAAAQLAGSRSMMNPGAGSGTAPGNP